MQSIEQFLKIVRPYRWSIEDMQTMIKSTSDKKEDILKMLSEQHSRQDNNAVHHDASEVYFVGSFKVGFKYLVDSGYNIIQSARDFESCCLIYRNNFILEIFRKYKDKYAISRIFNTSGKELLDIVKLSNHAISDYTVDIKQIRDSQNRIYLVVSLVDIDNKTIVYRYSEDKQSLDEIYQLRCNDISIANVTKNIDNSKTEHKEVILCTYQTNAVHVHQIVDNADIVRSLMRKLDYLDTDWMDIGEMAWRDNEDSNELEEVFINNLEVTIVKLFDIDTFVEYAYLSIDKSFMECIQVIEYDETGNIQKVIDRTIENRQEFRDLSLRDYEYAGYSGLDNDSRSLYKVNQYDVKYGSNKGDDTEVYPVNIFADDGKQWNLLDSLDIEMPEAFE